jgi:hypothetical protein
LLRPEQFEQAARLLKSKGAKLGDVDLDKEDYRSVQRFLTPLGYGPTVMSPRNRLLAQSDAALARWQKLPSSVGLRKAVNDVLYQYKADLLKSLAVKDKLILTESAKKDRSASAGYSADTDAAFNNVRNNWARLKSISNRLSEQISSGQVDQIGLVQDFPELAMAVVARYAKNVLSKMVFPFAAEAGRKE